MGYVHTNLRDRGAQFKMGLLDDSMAAHKDAYSPWCSCTMRTMRSRTSGGNDLISCSWLHLLKVLSLLNSELTPQKLDDSKYVSRLGHTYL